MENLISIIVPAYNIENYLPKTLDSILAQEYTKLEIIVVNDGSKDGTAVVIDDYAARDSRIKAIHKENSGVTSARLRGLAEAKGDYIGFVDGDDYIEPQMYARLMENLQRHGADISHCGYQMVFPHGRIDYYYNTGKLTLQEGQQGCSDLLRGQFVEPGLVNKLYRRELFDGLEQWMDKSIRINEDLLMNFYLFRQAKGCVFEDVCPYHYVLRKGSAATSRLNEHKLADPVQVRRILLEETADMPEWNAIVLNHLAYQLITAATMPLGQQKELIKPHRKACRKELRQRLGSFLKVCGMKTKIMALWVGIWPGSYTFVHRVYAKISGVDKKFAVE